MRQFTLRVTEIATSGPQLGPIHVRCDGGPEPVAAPGQVCLALRTSPEPSDGEVDVLPQPRFSVRVPLFLFHTRNGGPEFFVDKAHPYAALEPGAVLDLIGPCGRGFTLPPRAVHLLLIAASLNRLYPLMQSALARRLAVALLVPGDVPLPELPPAVEIDRGALTADLAAWADVVALDVPDSEPRAREARTLCPARPASYVQALITPPMPCGTGACQACWVETDHGHKLACVDGPVFHL